jgi:hypothetical protein
MFVAETRGQIGAYQVIGQGRVETEQDERIKRSKCKMKMINEGLTLIFVVVGGWGTGKERKNFPPSPGKPRNLLACIHEKIYQFLLLE